MPVLWTPTYTDTADFVLNRARLWGFAVGWVNATTLQQGRTTIIREIPFGGYRFVIQWRQWVWDAESDTFEVPEAIENLYVLAPGSTTPISAGATTVNFQNDLTYKVPLLVFVLAGSTGIYKFYPFPPVAGYWQPPITPHPTIPTPT